jgi:ADP-ribose pyrophosphatase
MTEKNFFSNDDYEITQKELLYQGVFRLMRYHIRHRLFENEEWSRIFTREIFERKPAVAVLPYDPILDKVILIEQFRAGAFADSLSPWLVEVVAGIYNPNETPYDVAKRESQEEAGCEIIDLHPICEFFVSPGGSNERLALFVGWIDASNAGGIFGLPEENENIRATVYSRKEAWELLEAGKIKT